MASDAPGLDAFDRSRRHRRGVTEASTEFQDVLASPAGLSDGWIDDVRRHLEHLSAAFTRHVDGSEGPDGLLQEIIEAAPHLANAVERVKKDHQEILARLVRQRGMLDQVDAEMLISDVRDSGLQLVQRIAAHRHQGADLIYEAYSVDVEGGG